MTIELDARELGALTEALVKWWASELDDEDDARFVLTSPESFESAKAYIDALAPTVARIADGRVSAYRSPT